MICIMSFSSCYPSLMNQTSAWSVLPCLVIWLEKAKFPLMNWMNIFQLLKKTDSLSTASLVGVKVRNEFVYPLEGFFTSYLSDHLDDDVSVLDSNHPFRFRLYHGFPQSWKYGRRFPQSWKYIHLLPVVNHTMV